MKQIILILGLMSMAYWSNATIITVNNQVGSSADFDNVTNAMALAVHGDTIYVQPSATSYGSIAINKRLIIMGAGHNPSFSPYNSSFTTVTFQNSSSNAILKGLNINTVASATSATVNNIVISGCRISNYGGQCIDLASGTYNNWIFEGCVLETTTASFFNFEDFGSDLILRNNLISQNSYSIPIGNLPSGTTVDHNFILSTGNTNFEGVIYGSNILVTNNIIATNASNNYGIAGICASCTFNNNILYNLGSGPFPTTPGNNNQVNVNPQFVNFNLSNIFSYDWDLNLAVNSSGIGAATDGSDIGLYGGIFNYNENGIDGGTPYIIDFSLESATAPQGGTITINLNASGSGQ